MGVALEAFWGGPDGSARLEGELASLAGVGVSMGSTALKAALDRFGARRVAILTPHQPKGDDEVRAWFEATGYAVIGLKGLACESPRAIAQVKPAAIWQALRELDTSEVEALVQVGTNLAGAAVAVEAERWFGKPVLAINSVTYWHALRGLGIKDRLPGQGSVLERF